MSTVKKTNGPNIIYLVQITLVTYSLIKNTFCLCGNALSLFNDSILFVNHLWQVDMLRDGKEHSSTVLDVRETQKDLCKKPGKAPKKKAEHRWR